MDTAGAGLAGGLLYGLVSAFLPFLSSEAFVVGVAATAGPRWWHIALAMGLGLTLGKVAQVVAVRRGATWAVQWLERRGARDGVGAARRRPLWRRRVAAWGEVMLRFLDHPVRGGLVVLSSAAVGVPPLLLVTLAVGARRTPVWVFFVACLVGRTALILAIGTPIAAARA